MVNRSVTAYVDHAQEVVEELGKSFPEVIINGKSWKGIDGRDRILVTVINQENSVKSNKNFLRCKKNGWISNWSVA